MTMSGQEIVSMSKQPVRDTVVAPGILVPVLPGSFRANETKESVYDLGRRGRPAAKFGAYEGVKSQEISWEGNCQSGDSGEKAVIGYLLKNILGDGGTPSFTPAQVASLALYDHRLTLGTTKEYLTIQHDSGALATATRDRQFLDCRVTELTIAWDSGEGAVTYRVTLAAQGPSLVDATVLNAAKLASPSEIWRGWQCLTTFGAVVDSHPRVISGEWTFRRAAAPFYSGNNSQDTYDIYVEDLDVTVSLLLDYSVATDIDVWRTTPSLANSRITTTFRNGTANALGEETLAISMPHAWIPDGPAELDSSGANVKLGITASGLYFTGAGILSSQSGGNAVTAALNSPVEIQIMQEKSNAY